MSQLNTSRRELSGDKQRRFCWCRPPNLGAENKSGSKPPMIGPEGFQYEVHHNCTQIPEHIRWQDTHGVAVDTEVLIYVKHRTMTADPQDAVVVFDGDGTCFAIAIFNAQ